MSLIADGVLIATCLTTAIYCVMLSRRLKRLSATDDGIGQQILRLNQVLDETKAAVAEIQGTTRKASEGLAADIDAARRLGEQLQRQIARAMKSGVGRYEPEHAVARIIAEPAVAGNAVPAADAAADEEPTQAMTEAAPVVDFEAAEEIDRPEDDPVATETGDEQDDHAFEKDGMDAEEESPGASDDIAEASDHWPFDESGEAMASDEELTEPPGEEDEPLASETQPGDGREGAAGLLRVERMAV